MKLLPSRFQTPRGIRIHAVVARPRSPRHRLQLLAYLAALPLWLLALQGCSIGASRIELATSLDKLVPHGDRDHFVFRWERVMEGTRLSSGIQVEHVASLTTPGDFEVTLSEDGLASGRVRIHSDGKAMVVMSEDDMSRGIRITYQPPLPYVEVPLFSGQRQSTVNANITALDNDEALGVLKVTQNQEFAAAPPLQSALGSFTTPIAVRTTRTLEGGGDRIDINSQVVLAPGLGEIRSEATSTQAPILRRELICAIIGGHSIGDCQKLRRRGGE